MTLCGLRQAFASEREEAPAGTEGEEPQGEAPSRRRGLCADVAGRADVRADVAGAELWLRPVAPW